MTQREMRDTPPGARPWAGPPQNRRAAYLAGMISFGAKGVCAFAITYWMGNGMTPPDLALWATLFSFGTILSVADLGVGQLILTTLHEKSTNAVDDRRLITNSVAALVLLSTLVMLAMSGYFAWAHVLEGVRGRFVLIALILARLVFIPHGAFLMALERYHERKAAEALSYVVAAVFIFWGIRANVDISTFLFGMNLILTLGSVAVGLRATQLGMASVDLKQIDRAEMVRVVRDSFPYFVNNVSGLAIYGGFIALSSMILVTFDLARLSLLHTILFMHLYQVFELIFRLVQPRMQDPKMMARLRLFVGGSYVLGMLISGLAGSQIAAFAFKKYSYSPGELLMYTTFVFLETYYLLLTSRMQMKSALRGSLQWMSIVKAAAFVVLLLLIQLVDRQPSLAAYAGFLAAYSAAMGWMGWQVERREKQTPLGFQN